MDTTTAFTSVALTEDIKLEKERVLVLRIYRTQSAECMKVGWFCEDAQLSVNRKYLNWVHIIAFKTISI